MKKKLYYKKIFFKIFKLYDQNIVCLCSVNFNDSFWSINLKYKTIFFFFGTWYISHLTNSLYGKIWVVQIFIQEKVFWVVFHIKGWSFWKWYMAKFLTSGILGKEKHVFVVYSKDYCRNFLPCYVSYMFSTHIQALLKNIIKTFFSVLLF